MSERFSDDAVYAKELKGRIAELEAENAKLRAALEAAAEALQLCATRLRVDISNAYNHHSSDYGHGLDVALLTLKTHAVDAMRACWAALGKES